MSYSAKIIAKYIITKCASDGTPISNLKLQKLLYFAWVDYYKATGKELFSDDICAWPLGTVVPTVYYEFCMFGGKAIDRDYSEEVTKYILEEDRNILTEIISQYQDYSTGWLVDMTHIPGKPWDVVYKGGKGNRNIIPPELIKSLG